MNHQYRRRDVVDMRERRAPEVISIVPPWKIAEPVRDEVIVEIAGTDRTEPVGHRPLDHGGTETPGLPHGPAGQEAPTAATCDAESLLIDVTVRQHLIDAGHEVAIVIARIAVLDDVGELLAVAGTAARIRDQQDEARLRQHLELVKEAGAVHRVRPAVDVEDHRVLAAGIEPRRLDDPALDLPAIEGLVGDLFVSRESAGWHMPRNVCGHLLPRLVGRSDCKLVDLGGLRRGIECGRDDAVAAQAEVTYFALREATQLGELAARDHDSEQAT